MFFKTFTLINIFYITQIYCTFYNLKDNLDTLYNLEEEFNLLENIKQFSDSDKKHFLSFISPEIKALSSDITTCAVLQKIYNLLNYQTITIDHALNSDLESIIRQGFKTRLKKEELDIVFFKKIMAILQKCSAHVLLLNPEESFANKALQFESLENNTLKVLLFMILISQGFNVNSVVNPKEQTILMVILENKTEIIIFDLFLLFLSSNLNLYHEDIAHNPLAFYLYAYNYHEYVKILIDNGLDINYSYHNNMVLLDYLVLKKVYRIIFDIYTNHSDVKKRTQALLNTTFHLDIRYVDELVKSGSHTINSIEILNARISQSENSFLRDKPYLMKRLMTIINPN